VATTLERCGTRNDLLHRVVRDAFPHLRDAAEDTGRSLPAFVERAVARYLACGDPAEGFAWLVCEACDHHRLVPFSCKTRAICPSCGGRRMASRAAWLVDHVIPAVPVRQWVLTVPWHRRFLLARRPDLARGVLSVALGVLFRWYAERARAPREGRCGAVTVVQRFGSALNLNLHFHLLIPDGAWVPGPSGGPPLAPAFRSVLGPTTQDVEDLVVRLADACERFLARRGFGEDDGADDPDSDDAQVLLQQASLAGVAALGRRAGRQVRRLQVHGGRAYPLPPRCAGCDGYNLHAGVRVAAHDRSGLERLCRYVSRPPLARARLEEQNDGTLVLHLKTPWADGTTALHLSPLELVERLVALIPPSRKNEVLYHGVFAAHAAWRPRVVPRPQPDAATPHAHRRLARSPAPAPDPYWPAWASLLWRVFQIDPLLCPICGQSLRLRTVVLPPATLDVLAGLHAAAARGPPSFALLPPTAGLTPPAAGPAPAAASSALPCS
jgi:hypothetical protein